jgi:hypothetical protein
MTLNNSNVVVVMYNMFVLAQIVATNKMRIKIRNKIK